MIGLPSSERLKVLIEAFEALPKMEQGMDFSSWIADYQKLQLHIANYQTSLSPGELQEATKWLLARRFAKDFNESSIPRPQDWPGSQHASPCLTGRIEPLNLIPDRDMPQISRASTDHVADRGFKSEPRKKRRC